MKTPILILAILTLSIFVFGQNSGIYEKAIYYQDVNSIKELNEIQKLIKPSLTKSEFYKYYFEKLIIQNLKKQNEFKVYSDKILTKLFYLSLDKSDFIWKTFEKKDILKTVNEIDSLFNTIDLDKENDYSSGLYQSLASNYINTYFVYEPVKLVDNFVLMSCNLNGNAASSRHKLFKIENDDVVYIYLDDILNKVALKMEKHLGKGCYTDFSRSGLEFKKVTGKYEITVDLYKSDDYGNSPTYSVKFITESFYDFDEKSIMYGKDDEDIKWLKY